jgi:hypothetical protein
MPHFALCGLTVDGGRRFVGGMKAMKRAGDPHGLADLDYGPVRSLIAEACRNQNLINEVVTWKNAFVLFKQCDQFVISTRPLRSQSEAKHAHFCTFCGLTGRWPKGFLCA